MKNNIKNTFLLGATSVLAFLSSQVAEATVHLPTYADLYCQNATEVSERDAFCNTSINHEIVFGRMAECAVVIFVLVKAIQAANTMFPSYCKQGDTVNANRVTSGLRIFSEGNDNSSSEALTAAVKRGKRYGALDDGEFNSSYETKIFLHMICFSCFCIFLSLICSICVRSV